MLSSFVNGLAHRFGVHVSRHRPERENLPAFVSPGFVVAYRRIRHATMTTWTGCHQTWLAARYVAQAGIPGDVVECGVYKGGLSILMAEATGKRTWMYDTFAGMTDPTDADFARHDGRKAADLLAGDRGDGIIRAVGPLDTVRQNIAASGIPPDRFVTVQGKVEDTIPAQMPERIALLRLDTDWYASTRHELEHLFPRLSPGGVLIVDDYGIWDGARKAVDEYFAARGLALPVAQNTEYGSLVCVLPA